MNALKCYKHLLVSIPPVASIGDPVSSEFFFMFFRLQYIHSNFFSPHMRNF